MFIVPVNLLLMVLNVVLVHFFLLTQLLNMLVKTLLVGIVLHVEDYVFWCDLLLADDKWVLFYVW